MGTGSARSLAFRLLRSYHSPLPPPKPPLLSSPLDSHHKPLPFPSPSFSFFHPSSRLLSTRYVSQLAPNESKKVIFVDTLSLVRKLEAQGFTATQAEAITAVITDVLYDCLESVGHSFVSKTDLQKSDMLQEAALSKLKAEVESSQENKLSIIQRESEKLRIDIDKLRTEMRYEMDKISAGQRLDLNLERGRMREELTKQNTETSNLTNKLNKEIHALKTQLEASKYEVIKYCIGTIVSVIALGLGLLRIFK